MKKLVLIIMTASGIGLSAHSQTLDDYVKTAAENNPGLQSRYREYEAALQKVPQAAALPDPAISFGYFISPVETRVGPQQAKFSLTQMFPWFGTLKAQGNAAALQAEARLQAFMDARNQLVYQVAEAYYPLYELQEWTRIEQENILILESYKSLANTRYQNGKGAMVDVLRADMMLKEATTNLSVLRQKEKPLITRFNQVLNRPEGEAVVVPDTLMITEYREGYRKDSLLSANPLIDELELKVRASEAGELAVRRQGLPRIGLGLDYVLVGNRTDMDLPDNGKNVLMPMVSVSIPIFRSKYKAAQKEAQLMQDSYSLQKKELGNRLVTAYDKAWFEIQQQHELARLYEQQTEESQQSLDLLFAAYSNSGKDFEEVLRMQQQVLKYQKLKASALTQYQIARAEMDYLTAKTY